MTMKAASALTRSSDPTDAARELVGSILERLPEVDHLLIFATHALRERLGELCTSVRQGTGARRVVACTGIGVLSEAGEIEEAPGAVALAFAPGAPIAFATAPRPPGQDSLRAMGRALLEDIRPLSPPSGLLLVTTPQIGWPEDLVEELQSAGAPIFGGGLYSPSPELAPRLFVDGEASEKMALLVAFGPSLDVMSGFSQAMSPREGTHVITRAQGPHILELDGRPARSVLEESVGAEAVHGVLQGTYPIFLGFPLDAAATRLERGSYLVRNLSGLHPRTGALITTAPPRVGERLGFVVRDIEAAKQDMRRMTAELTARPEARSAAFGIYVNCCARGRDFYRSEDVDTAILRNSFPGLPLVGFFGAYELCPVGGRQPVQAYTGVLVIVAPH